MKTKKTEIKIIADPADENGISEVRMWLDGKPYGVTYSGLVIGKESILAFLHGLAVQGWTPIEKLATKQAGRKSTSKRRPKGRSAMVRKGHRTGTRGQSRKPRPKGKR
jgi:hypothetical protein